MLMPKYHLLVYLFLALSAKPILAYQLYHQDHRQSLQRLVQAPVAEPTQLSIALAERQALARSYLQQHAEQLALAPGLDGIEWLREQHSLSAQHHYFQQYHQGKKVENAQIVVSVERTTGQLLSLYNNSHLFQAQEYSKQTPLTSEQALAEAWRHVPARVLVAEPDIEAVYVPIGRLLRDAYHIRWRVQEPHAVWSLWLDRYTGELLRYRRDDSDAKADTLAWLKSAQPNDAPLQQARQQLAMAQADQLRQQDAGLMTALGLTEDASEAEFKRVLDDPSLLQLLMNEGLQQENDQKGGDTGPIWTPPRLTVQAEAADGSALVFDPDPRTTLLNNSLKDDSPQVFFTDAYKERPLNNLSYLLGRYWLSGPWVRISDWESPYVWPSTTDDGQWQFLRGEAGFNDVMVFYHIDKNQRYLQSLGFVNETGIQQAPIVADAHGVYGDDNSYYLPSLNRLSFGTGCVDDAEDADVILHEYGHALQYAINPDWYGGDTGAIGEGFGDYWAGAYSFSTENGLLFFPERVFQWDAHDDCWEGRQMNLIGVSYDPNHTYTAHEHIDDYIADELWSTPLFQALLLLTGQGYPQTDADQIVIESHFGMGADVTMRQMARNLVEVAARLFPDGPHAAIYNEQFRRLGILQPALVLGEPELLAEGGSEVLNPGATVQLQLPLHNDSGLQATAIEAWLSSSASAVTISPVHQTYASMAPWQEQQADGAWQIQLDPDWHCGDAVPMALELRYQHPQAEQPEQSDVLAFELATGSRINYGAVEEALLAIPDNDSQGLQSQLLIENTGALVDGNLSVSLNLSHSYVGDLMVTLTSPAGTEVILWNRSGGGDDDILGSFPDTLVGFESLALFAGEPLDGLWILSVSDHAERDVGTLNEWGLSLSSQAQCELQASAQTDMAVTLTELDAQPFAEQRQIQVTLANLSENPAESVELQIEWPAHLRIDELPSDWQSYCQWLADTNLNCQWPQWMPQTQETLLLLANPVDQLRLYQVKATLTSATADVDVSNNQASKRYGGSLNLLGLCLMTVLLMGRRRRILARRLM